ncbi:hypothetical protein ACP70R_026653 [Stipagrostis hirtigluma subsp. patula]
MDRLQRRNPSSRLHSTSLRPPRPPRGLTFKPPPASRLLPEPSSPDGRQRKKVRFANEAGNRHISGREVVNVREGARTKPQVCDAKTTEYKFFKKLCEQSGHRSHSYKHSHQRTEPTISKQKQEPHNVTPLRKFSVQSNTLCRDDQPATPPRHEEIPEEQMNVESAHSEYDDKYAPRVDRHDYLPSIHVLTPIAQTSLEVAGISRNIDREPVSDRIFSEKRSKLLKLAAKTVSMGSAELLQRRSEFVGEVLQRLGVNNIIRKQHHENSVRHSKIDCRKAPAITKGHFDNLLGYKQSAFYSLEGPRRTSKRLSSYASDEACEFMALPWGYDWGRPNFIDWKNDLPCGGNEAPECMALPLVSIKDISNSHNRGTVRNQVSNLLLENVEPYIHGRSASANESSLDFQIASHDQHGWAPMLPVTLTESFRDRFSFPCQTEEQHAVPFAISNAPWQADLCRSIQQCTSGSVGLERADPSKAALCDNYDAGFSTRFDQFLAEPAASSFLDSGNEILDHNDFRYISNFHASHSNNVVLSANTSCLSSMYSTPEHPYELGSKSLHDSAVGISCLAGLEEKYSAEIELTDNSDRLVQVLDQLPVKFIHSSFSNDKPGIWDHHHLRYIASCHPEDSGSILSLDANDRGLKFRSSYSEHPVKQDWDSLHDSCTELWSSVHPLQSHANLEAVFGFKSTESAFSDLDHSLMLFQGNLNNDVLDTTDLSFFGSCSATDNIKEAPMLAADRITW